MKRRHFLRATALAAGALSAAQLDAANDITKQWNSKKKSGFTLWQIPSHRNTIGNSYVMRTSKGKVIVMDGGFPQEELTLRGFIGALGNQVDAWFISHPHDDHFGALIEILKNPQHMRIKSIIHSRLPEAVLKAEPQSEKMAREFYTLLQNLKDTQVFDLQQPGDVFRYDDMQVKVLGVANDFTGNSYNNSSMIYRVWDRRKSILFLGDAGVECGQKALDGPFRNELDCEYIQMAHHGQNGCDEHFYKTVKFRACLWPTPTWVWNNDQGKGFDTGILKTVEVRKWMEKLGIQEHHTTCIEGLWQLD